MDVFVRVRPLFQEEIESSESLLNWYNDENSIYQCIPGTQTLIPSQQEYSFDSIFGKESNTAQVYETAVAPIVEESLQGFNGNVLCYGQGSSGKTHTLYGNTQDPGIITLTVQDLFRRMNEDQTRTYFSRISLLGVSHQKYTDLLNYGRSIEVLEINGMMVPKNLKEIEIVSFSAKDTLQIVKLLQEEREIDESRMNHGRSYSTILRISIESVPNEAQEGDDHVTSALLHIVDLPESEKASQTGVAPNESSITTSASSSTSPNSTTNTGSNITNQPSKFFNFRNSNLARLLNNFLNSSDFISLICNVNPLAVEETHSTLSFAEEAKRYKLQPTRNHEQANPILFRNKVLELEKLLKRAISEVETFKKYLSTMQKFDAKLNQLTTGAKTVQSDSRESDLSMELEKMSLQMELTTNENKDLRSIIETMLNEMERTQEQNLRLQEQLGQGKEIRERLELDLQTLQTQSEDSKFFVRNAETLSENLETALNDKAIKVQPTCETNLNDLQEVNTNLVDPDSEEKQTKELQNICNEKIIKKEKEEIKSNVENIRSELGKALE